MVHIDNPNSPLENLLSLLRKDDIFTHCYNSDNHGMLDANGKILPVAIEARQCGVIFDCAQGSGHLNFDVAEKCMAQNFLCDTISTDLTKTAVGRRIFDLPTMVSKFMALGVSMDKAFEMKQRLTRHGCLTTAQNSALFSLE